MPATTTRPTPTLAEFKRFSQDIAPAARAVLMARVFAEMERERVSAYTLPIFLSYQFTYGTKYPDLPHAGQPMTDPKDLYLVDDLHDPLVLAFYADCDTAHRAHGFTGKPGHCPALEAESLVRIAEGLLIDLSEPLFGITKEHIHGANRDKLLDLLIGSGLKAEKDGTR